MSILGQFVMPISIFIVFWITEYIMSTFFGFEYFTYQMMLMVSMGAMIGYSFRPQLDESIEKGSGKVNRK